LATNIRNIFELPNSTRKNFAFSSKKDCDVSLSTLHYEISFVFCHKVSLSLYNAKIHPITAVMLISKASLTITSFIKGGLPYPKSCEGVV